MIRSLWSDKPDQFWSWSNCHVSEWRRRRWKITIIKKVFRCKNWIRPQLRCVKSLVTILGGFGKKYDPCSPLTWTFLHPKTILRMSPWSSKLLTFFFPTSSPMCSAPRWNLQNPLASFWVERGFKLGLPYYVSTTTPGFPAGGGRNVLKKKKQFHWFFGPKPLATC